MEKIKHGRNFICSLKNDIKCLIFTFKQRNYIPSSFMILQYYISQSDI